MSQKNDVQWVRPVSPETIPPGAGEFRSSPRVWVALSDGSVYMGSCLHRAAGAKYRDLVHDWFLDHPVYGSSSLGCSYFNGATVEAWAELVFPEHPRSRPMSTSEKDRVLAVLDHHTSHMATAAMRKVRSVRPEWAAKIATDLREVRAEIAEVYAQRDALLKALICCRHSLRESAKQHRLAGDHGHARHCETIADEADTALARVQGGVTK